MHDTPPDHRDDEPSVRTRLVQEFDIFRSGTEKHAKRVHWWVQALGGALVALIAVCVKVGFFLSDVAHKDQMQAVESRQLVVETKLDMLIRMQEQQGEQMKAVAKTVKAPVVLPLEERQLQVK
jgi:uncharacterized membrane protein